ncbi:MAG TPA: hypothetical protein VEY12_11960 [Thermoplasmata archaeon]|nr:hypothetical protein [Thermoplasmata archaeon]
MAADRLSLLSGLPAGTFRFGTVVLVEYESHSPWYETSVTLAANALAGGIRTDYHTFQHMPDDVVASLEKQGVNVVAAQRQGRLRLIDSYSPQTGLADPVLHRPYEFASQSLRIADWKKGSTGVLQEPEEHHLLHIDENDSVLLHYNREREVIDFFRTRAFEAARKRDFLFVHGFTAGVHSKPFYRKFETLADVVLDLRTREVEGQLERLLRVRAIRGMAVDSRWRLLTLTARGQVRVLGPARVGERVPSRPRRSAAETRGGGPRWSPHCISRTRGPRRSSNAWSRLSWRTPRGSGSPSLRRDGEASSRSPGTPACLRRVCTHGREASTPSWGNSPHTGSWRPA